MTYPDSARVIGSTRHSGGIGGSGTEGNQISIRDSRGWIHCVYSSAVGHPYATGVPSDIFYVFSTDNGITWSRPINVSNIDTCNSDKPNLTVDSRNILHCVWRQFYETHNPLTRGEDLVYSSCINGIWSNPVNISRNPGTKGSYYSSLVIDSNERLHVVWDRQTGSGNWDIFYSYLNDDNWSTPYNVSQDPYDSAFPSLVIDSHNCLHLVYRTRIARIPIMYTMYDGNVWSIPIIISDTFPGSLATILVDSQDNLHVNFKGYYTKKVNNQWTYPQRIVNMDDTLCEHFDFAIDVYDNLYMVWQARILINSLPREEIYFCTFNGTSWSPAINITQDTTRSWTPKLGNPVHSQGVDLVWLDLNPPQQYPWALDVVYLRLNPISVAIEEYYTQPSALRLSLKVERRINPAAAIFSIPAFQRVNLKLYDINGRLIEDLVNETKEPGIYKINLNTKSLPSGIYFLSLTLSSGQALQTDSKRIIERIVIVK